MAEVDDVPVACGAYRLLDDATAEVKRMYVDRSARGLRLGAAVVAELEAVARTDRGAAAAAGNLAQAVADAASDSGFDVCPVWAERTLSPDSVFLEKTLTAEPSRLA